MYFLNTKTLRKHPIDFRTTDGGVWRFKQAHLRAGEGPVQVATAVGRYAGFWSCGVCLLRSV